ncbi:M48 family metallopeptidase [Dermabacteraceae bacterium TAE3-ERU27]|nr:M48 family metallopeptidase [Dermabacteraceae bacterium TAE3-ERU27]
MSRRETDLRGPRDETVVVVRSARRKRTVSITRRNGQLEVSIPASFTRGQEKQWVEKMLARIEAKEELRKLGDEELLARARHLVDTYLDSRAYPVSVTWSKRQHTTWGTCTPSDATIRLASVLQTMPDWVIDYVLVHELTHLLHPDHSEEFWALVARYPRSERARGYLDGYAAARDR